MRSNLYIKVVVEHEKDETPERLAAEIARQVRKVYGVIQAELSSVSPEHE
jgi:hypothetical protein